MKKTVLTLFLALSARVAMPRTECLAAVPALQEVTKDSGVASLLVRNRELTGLKMRSLGGAWIKLLGKLAGAGSEDPDVMRILSGIGGINRILVVDISECSVSDKEEFLTDLNSLLSRSEKMFEGKDGSDSLGIYGIPDTGEDKKVRDIVLIPKSGTTFIFAVGGATTSLLSSIMSADTI